MPLRTLHLNDQHGWRGGEQQVLALTQGLVSRGCGVLLMAQPQSELCERARAAGVPVEECGTKGEVSPGAVLRIRQRIRTYQPDIVHCHTSHSHMHGLLACLGNSTPKLVVSRRVDFSIHKAPFRLALLKYRTRVDRILAISAAVRNVLAADGVPPNDIGVVLSGLDPARSDGVAPVDLHAEFGIAAGAPVACTVAALVGHKGHRFLIDAIPAIRQEFPLIRLLFVGEGPLLGELRRRADRLGVGDAIIFAGFRTDFLALTRACDLYIMPSHLEGLNTSVIDAMFLARPVVVTAAGGLPELVQDGVTGWVVQKESPTALAEGVCAALRDRPEARTRSAAARAWALDHVTADHMVAGTLDEYARLLGHDL